MFYVGLGSSFGTCIAFMHVKLKKIFMNKNHFSICPSCIYRNTCVLTAQKDKVWSCSEFDDELPSQTNVDTLQQPNLQLELI